MSATEIKSCRICGSTKPFLPILNLGNQYIANAFYKKDEPLKESMPLNLVRCAQCDLVQLQHAIDPDMMYRNYWYTSGMNNTMKNHLSELVNDICQSMIELQPKDVWIDIGCNDGTLLGNLPSNVHKIGVDPSNIQQKKDACNVFINNYFSHENLKEELGNRKAKVITSIAMFYDLNDPKAFVKDIRKCLQDDGVWVLELSYLSHMLSKTSIDTICHEHVCYYRIETFQKTLQDTDLEIKKISFNDINGGSFRLFVAPKNGNIQQRKSVKTTHELETEAYSDNKMYLYDNFKSKAMKAKIALLDYLTFWKNSGTKVYGYGASTKGQVLMQYCNITPNLITAIAEKNPKKVGLYTPGTNIRICSEEEMRKNTPDYLVIFPWYFRDEFIKREQKLLQSGCRMVFPLPEFDIYGVK